MSLLRAVMVWWMCLRLRLHAPTALAVMEWPFYEILLDLVRYRWPLVGVYRMMLLLVREVPADYMTVAICGC